MRAASVSALGLISLQDPGLSSHILNILELFRDDRDSEEVSYRAAYFTQLLEEDQSSEKVESQSERVEASEDRALDLAQLDGLLSQLDSLIGEGAEDLQGVDLFARDASDRKSKAKVLSKTERIQQKHHKKEAGQVKFAGNAETGDPKVGEFLKNKLGEQIGKCVFSSEAAKLSEEDFEYYVRARKHTFENLVVVEFIVENNSENQIEKVQIKLGRESANPRRGAGEPLAEVHHSEPTDRGLRERLDLLGAGEGRQESRAGRGPGHLGLRGRHLRRGLGRGGQQV